MAKPVLLADVFEDSSGLKGRHFYAERAGFGMIAEQAEDKTHLGQVAVTFFDLEDSLVNGVSYKYGREFIEEDVLAISVIAFSAGFVATPGPEPDFGTMQEGHYHWPPEA